MREAQELKPGYRRQVIDTARRVVVKVGSAVLTAETGLDLELIQGLARQVSGLLDEGREVVMVSSGAVAAGRRVIAASVELNGLPARQAASAVGQSRLMHAYDEAFASQGKVTAQILVSKDGLESRRRFLHARNTLATLLSWRAVPIVNENDTVAVEELEFGDNDFLASLIVNLVEADLMVNLTSAEGVFSANPDRDAGAHCLECIPDIAGLDLDALCSGKSTVGTGGMYSKLLSARRVAQLGV
ncbi:MAG: glutamate 5-kinase, partial [Desulfohalobiaceae bacterium]